jgi:hypothetical protein
MQYRNSAWCDIDDTPLSLPREGAATVVLGYRRMNLLKVLCLRHIRKRPRRSGASLYAGAEGPSTPPARESHTACVDLQSIDRRW